MGINFFFAIHGFLSPFPAFLPRPPFTEGRYGPDTVLGAGASHASASSSLLAGLCGSPTFLSLVVAAPKRCQLSDGKRSRVRGGPGGPGLLVDADVAGPAARDTCTAGAQPATSVAATRAQGSALSSPLSGKVGDVGMQTRKSRFSLLFASRGRGAVTTCRLTKSR